MWLIQGIFTAAILLSCPVEPPILRDRCRETPFAAGVSGATASSVVDCLTSPKAFRFWPETVLDRLRRLGDIHDGPLLTWGGCVSNDDCGPIPTPPSSSTGRNFESPDPDPRPQPREFVCTDKGRGPCVLWYSSKRIVRGTCVEGGKWPG